MANKSRYTFTEFIGMYSIRIPLIQRDYVQGRESSDERILEKRQEFIRLLLNALRSGKKYHVDFIYGSPVQDQKTKTGKSFFIPLDGQQRLTTLFLLHWILINKSSRETGDKKELLEKLRGFSYETRLSSAAFCDKLANNVLPKLPCGKVKEVISECPWYSSDWDFDPTICNMISMLEAMNSMLENNYASDIDMMLENILSPATSITFDLLDMKEYALTDGLYIKMNARGKELTDFEHWKALFIQLLEDNYQKEGYKTLFTDKIEHEWANLFWDYVKEDSVEYPTIDNCFMAFFHYFTNLLFNAVVYPQQADPKNDYIGTIEQINAVYRNQNCVEALFDSLDFLSITGKKESTFFDDIFKHGNGDYSDKKIRLFSKGRINLFQRCILPQENESFDIYEKILLYALIKYCTKQKVTMATTQLRQYVRVVRNLLLNTNQFIQAQVNLVSNLRINEFASYNQVIELLSSHPNINETLSDSITGLGGKNAAMSEKEKMELPNREMVCWLEDLPFCRGNIKAFMPIINYPQETLKERVSLFNEANDADRVRVLIASGYNGFGVGWCMYGNRCFFGKEGRWDVVFSRDSESVGNALKVFVDSNYSIDEYIKHNIPQAHDFRYYSLKYKDFICSSGYRQIKDDSNSLFYFAVQNDLDDLDMIALKSYSRSPLLAYHTEPFASTVLWKLIDELPDVFGNGKLQNWSIHREKASLTYIPDNERVALSIKIQDKKWHIEFPKEIPSEIISKYAIVENCLEEKGNKDLVETAAEFFKDMVKTI